MYLYTLLTGEKVYFNQQMFVFETWIIQNNVFVSTDKRVSLGKLPPKPTWFLKGQDIIDWGQDIIDKNNCRVKLYTAIIFTY